MKKISQQGKWLIFFTGVMLLTIPLWRMLSGGEVSWRRIVSLTLGWAVGMIALIFVARSMKAFRVKPQSDTARQTDSGSSR